MLTPVSAPPLLLSLGIGMSLIVAANFLARQRLGRVRGAVTVLALTLFSYLPYAAWRWPGADVVAIHLALFLTTSLAFGLIEGGSDRDHRAPRFYVVGVAVFAAMVVIVNVVMVTVSDSGLNGRAAALALPEPLGGGVVSSRFPGTVTPDVGHRQVLYQRHLELIEEQAALGWEIRKGWLQKPQAGSEAVFQVALGSNEGSPLTGAKLDGIFLRPSDPRMDQAFVMSEPSPGLYRVEITLPEAGLWELLLRIERGSERFELRGSTSVGVNTSATTRSRPSERV